MSDALCGSQLPGSVITALFDLNSIKPLRTKNSIHSSYFESRVESPLGGLKNIFEFTFTQQFESFLKKMRVKKLKKKKKSQPQSAPALLHRSVSHSNNIQQRIPRSQ